MSSAAVSRANAQHSTGPRTEAGKAIVSQNARRHGLAAQKFVLTHEELDAFEQHRAALIDTWKPQGDDELRLLENHARDAWRLLRLREQEAAFWNSAIEEIRKAHPDWSADQAMSHVFIESQWSRRLGLLMRYQSSIERAYFKSLQQLDKQLAARAQAEEFQRTAARRRERTAADVAMESKAHAEHIIAELGGPSFVRQMPAGERRAIEETFDVDLSACLEAA